MWHKMVYPTKYSVFTIFSNACISLFFVIIFFIFAALNLGIFILTNPACHVVNNFEDTLDSTIPPEYQRAINFTKKFVNCEGSKIYIFEKK